MLTRLLLTAATATAVSKAVLWLTLQAGAWQSLGRYRVTRILYPPVCHSKGHISPSLTLADESAEQTAPSPGTASNHIHSADTVAALRRAGDKNITVHILPHSSQECSRIFAKLLPEIIAHGVVGFDTEWRPEVQPGTKNKVAVIQISWGDVCLLLQPLHMDKLPPSLVDVLADPNIIKAGVNIQEDAWRLLKDYGVHLKGAVDVRVVATSTTPEVLQEGGGLLAMARVVLGRTADKAQQRSDWARAQLAPEQVVYAAQDAWLSYQLLMALYKRYCQQPLHPAEVPVSSPESQDNSVHLMQQLPVAWLTDRESRSDAAAQSLEVFHNSRSTCKPQATTAVDSSAKAALHNLNNVAVPNTALETGVNGSATITSITSAASHGRTTNIDVSTTNDCNSTAAAFSSIALEKYDTSGHNSTATKYISTAPAHAVTSHPMSIHAWLAPYKDNLKPSRLPKLVPSHSASVGLITSLTRSSSENSSATGNKAAKAPTKLPTRKTVLYENCRLLAPDGTMLCTTGNRKVQWYLERGLADVVSEEPLTIQLKFEPRGRGNVDDDYYLADKENRCTVCGLTGEYLRHSIVPHCYRQHFPKHMKSHLSHDIVLMCTACHTTCNIHDHQRMVQLGQQYNAPIAHDNLKFKHDHGASQARSAGRALANTKVQLPEDRKQQLLQVLRDYYGVQEITDELIARASYEDPRKANTTWVPHAEKVVKAIGTEGLEEFVKGWRRHFLAAMQPRHLPPFWSVDSRVCNSSSKADQPQLPG